MKIVINALLEGGRSGGVQNGIAVLARALSSADLGNMEVGFLTLDGHDDWLRSIVGSSALSLHPIERGTTRATASRLRQWRAGRQLEKGAIWLRDVAGRPEAGTGTFEALGADVVHFPYQRAELSTMPMVYQPWDLQHRHLPHLFSRASARYRDRLYRAYCQAAAAVVVPTEFVRKDVIASYEIEPSKVIVVAPFVADGSHLPGVVGSTGAEQPASARRTDDDGEPFALYPARTWKHKNHAGLIGALAICRRSGTDIPLKCTGAPLGNEDELLALARDLGVADLVEFTGFVSDQKLADLQRRARLLVFPSTFEGWGYPVLESFGHGVPVACSTGAWLDDAAGDAALRFDPHDQRAIAASLRELWTDERLRRDGVKRGIEHLQSFTADRMAGAYLSVYDAASRRSRRTLGTMMDSGSTTHTV